MYKKVHMKERFNSLRHFEKKHFNSVSHIGKQERFNSLSQKKDFNSLSHLEKEVHKKRFNSMSQVIFLEKKFNSESHTKKSSILWVISEKKGWILWVVLENFNSLSRIKKKVQCPKKVIFKKVQFCESYWKNTVLWVVFVLQKRKFHFESHSEKKDQFFESFFFFEKIF